MVHFLLVANKSHNGIDMNSIFAWHGIDVKWAYTELLSSITYQTACTQRARDVLHDAMLCFVDSKNPQRHQAPRAYLRGIVSHLLVNEFRYQSKLIELDTDSDKAYIEEHFAYSPEHLADIQQRLQHLQRIIDNLPTRCRQAFWLFQVESLSHKEVAAKLNISVNMVEKHIIRAMLDLRAAKQNLL